MHELCQNLVFRVVHVSDRMTLVDHMQIFLVMETPQGSDWMPIIPH